MKNGVSADKTLHLSHTNCIFTALVKVDDLKPVQSREKTFKRLVIKDIYKRIIGAMVQAYMLEKPGFSDIVSGKGRGLAMLLHGPPGKLP